MDVTAIDRGIDMNSKLTTIVTDHGMIDDVVDISVLTSFEEEPVSGEPDLVVELIDIFFDDVPQRLTTMREAQALGDGAALGATAHSLKGSSSSLGATQMAAICDEIEVTANNLSPEEINAVMNRLEAEFERVRLAFAVERKRRTA